jgi:hypothetical protein
MSVGTCVLIEAKRISIRTKNINYYIVLFSRAFRTSESADFSEVRVRKFRTLKTLRTRTQRVF